MMHPGVRNLGEAGGMARPAVRMMQIRRGKAGTAWGTAQEPSAVRNNRCEVSRKEG